MHCKIRVFLPSLDSSTTSTKGIAGVFNRSSPYAFSESTTRAHRVLTVLVSLFASSSKKQRVAAFTPKTTLKLLLSLLGK
jgi:hypothetical protein